MLTRQHFRLFAGAIAAIEDEDLRSAHATVISKVCADSNPNFNLGLFLKASNVAGKE